MEFQEGQIYEGAISLSGAEGPLRRWLVISPFGKTHIHSADEPLELHCWPLSVLSQGLQEGRLKLVGSEPDHPMIRLQRLKEAEGIPDSHLGLNGEAMEKMFELLRRAVDEREPYATYAAGEIVAFADRSPYSPTELKDIRARVERLLGAAG